MPIKITINDKEEWLFPKSVWTTKNLDTKNASFEINPNFYINSKKL